MVSFSCIFLIIFISFVESVDLYVALTGNDQTGNGTVNNPFATIPRAQTEIQKYKPLTAPVNVYIKGGVYHLANTLIFTSADSGSPNYRITYTAQSGTGEVHLSGALPVTGWTQTSNSSIWTAPLPATVPLPVRELFINGQRRDVARTDVLIYASTNGTTVTYQAGQLPGNVVPYHLSEVDIVMYQNWVASKHEISAIDTVNRVITLVNAFDTTWTSASGNRYYLENLYEAIHPGQFYYNSSSNHILYWPLAGETLNTADVEVPRFNELLRVAGTPASSVYVTDITFRNLQFLHSTVEFDSCFKGNCGGQSADFLVNATLHLIGAQRFLFDNVTVAHTGGNGVWLDQGTFNNSFSYCHLFDLGAGGIRIGPMSNVAAPQRAEGNDISNSILEDGSHIFLMGTGILAQVHAHTTIQHNLIHDFVYTAISSGWSWGYGTTNTHDSLIAYNNIYNIGASQLSDMGCIYLLGIQPNTQVVNNICHDVWSYGYGGWGLYTDEGSSGVVLTNNVVYRTKCAGFHQHYGQNNTIVNNIFSDIDIGGYSDSALRSDPASGACGSTSPSWQACNSFTFQTNIVYLNHSSSQLDVTEKNYNGWVNATFLSNDYWIDNGNTTSLRFNGTTYSSWQSLGKDKDSLLADPQFTNPGTDWWTLNPNSPAIKTLGFKPIDVSKVGPLPRDVLDAKNSGYSSSPFFLLYLYLCSCVIVIMIVS